MGVIASQAASLGEENFDARVFFPSNYNASYIQRVMKVGKFCLLKPWLFEHFVIKEHRISETLQQLKFGMTLWMQTI